MNTIPATASYCPVVADEQGNLWTDSLTIAEMFDREHRNVTRSIEQLITDGTIDALNFERISYIDSMSRTRHALRLDERGFLIAMPFIGGRRAREGQVRLVDEFLGLRRQLASHAESRLISAEERLTAIEAALYQRHPHWPTIHQCKTQGLTHRQTCEQTGHKDPNSISRNLRRMKEWGVTGTKRAK
ncbi:MAG: Rha family transcriptional regulator [Magnetococcales bacterium]|nr:Rha family transcriptional regulator [Magnetococcales bacterium]MBF0114710.1 Rha family transcriptional regulator [Magnetococcales bacterium]